jgi:hypothetical protein
METTMQHNIDDQEPSAGSGRAINETWEKLRGEDSVEGSTEADDAWSQSEREEASDGGSDPLIDDPVSQETDFFTDDDVDAGLQTGTLQTEDSLQPGIGGEDEEESSDTYFNETPVGGRPNPLR